VAHKEYLFHTSKNFGGKNTMFYEFGLYLAENVIEELSQSIIFNVLLPSDSLRQNDQGEKGFSFQYR
jgi:hypothetical protein